jgi:hypothetical protein
MAQALPDLGRIVLWDLAGGKVRHALPVVGHSARRLAFSPDGRYLAAAAETPQKGDPAAGQDRSLGVWELASGREILTRPMPPHTGAGAVAFTSDSRFLVTGMRDSTVLVWDVLPVARGAEPGSHRRPRLWADLADEDAGRAHRALAELVAWGEEAVTFLGPKLDPVRAPEPARLALLLADLDSPQFGEREKATRELEIVAETIRPDLERLGKAPSMEVRRRAGSLLAGADGPVVPMAVLRPLRAVAALEHVGTPAARQVLRRLASGAVPARLTRDAQAALDRLADRKGRP